MVATAILELWTPFTGSIEETVGLEAAWVAQSLEYLRELEGLTAAATQTSGAEQY